MNIQKVLETYDRMFGNHSAAEIEEFLSSKMSEAEREQDIDARITLLNEMVGFCRDTDQKEKGLGYCRNLVSLLHERHIQGSMPYATSLLNIANTARAFGEYDYSMNCYREAEEIYRKNVSEDSLSFASLYNNWSLLYQELGDCDHAERLIRKALEIIDQHPEALIEQATTRTNLATVLMETNREQKDPLRVKEALERLCEAIAIFEAQGASCIIQI